MFRAGIALYRDGGAIGAGEHAQQPGAGVLRLGRVRSGGAISRRSAADRAGDRRAARWRCWRSCARIPPPCNRRWRAPPSPSTTWPRDSRPRSARRLMPGARPYRWMRSPRDSRGSPPAYRGDLLADRARTRRSPATRRPAIVPRSDAFYPHRQPGSTPDRGSRPVRRRGQR